MKRNEMSFKELFHHEMVRYCTYAPFLALFFCSLSLYQRLIMEQYSLPYFHYGYAIIQALVLSKIILVGEYFQLGETFKNRSLIIPVVYKTVLFSFLVAIFSTLEHLIETRIHGKTLLEFYDSFMAHGKDALLAKILVVFWFFILFFSFLEISSALGEGKLFHLFFKRKSTEL